MKTQSEFSKGQLTQSFNNDQWQQENQSDEAFSIEILYTEYNYSGPWQIYVNGQLKHIYKTFAPFKKKAEKLIKEHSLIEQAI